MSTVDYSAQRYLYQNLITDSDNITPSSQATGVVIAFAKVAGEGGDAVLYASGDYSGANDRTVTVQIDDISGGDDIGNATFRYRYDTTAAGAWESSGVSTSTSAVSVGDEVNVFWVSTGGTDFAEGDTWNIEVKASYSPGHLIDLDRNTMFRFDLYTNDEMLDNDDFEDGFTGGLADDWAKVGASQTFAEETTTVHTAGGSAQKCTVAADGETLGISQSITTVAGTWYFVSAWVYLNSTRDVKLSHANLTGNEQETSVSATTWTQLTWNVLADAAGASNFSIYQDADDCTTADYIIIDDAHFYPLPTLTIDLESAQQCTALVILDHNFTSGVTIRHQANASDAWTSPTVDDTITNQNPIIEYFDYTYRYHRLVILDAENTDGYVECSELYLGTYLELTVQTAWGSSFHHNYTGQNQTTALNDTKQMVFARQRAFPLSFPRYIGNTDVDSLLTMQQALIDLDTELANPFFFHYMKDVDDFLTLVRWTNIFKFEQQITSYTLNAVSIMLVEVPKRGS
jgi:hypothetical protein